jgi:hypothetical protein
MRVHRISFKREMATLFGCPRIESSEWKANHKGLTSCGSRYHRTEKDAWGVDEKASIGKPRYIDACPFAVCMWRAMVMCRYRLTIKRGFMLLRCFIGKKYQFYRELRWYGSWGVDTTLKNGVSHHFEYELEMTSIELYGPHSSLINNQDICLIRGYHSAETDGDALRPSKSSRLCYRNTVPCHVDFR